MSVEGLSRALVQRGHAVTVYGRRGYCDPTLRDHDGVRQIPLGEINTKHLEAISHTSLATCHAIAHENYDLVHFHATGPSLLSCIPRVRGIPTVATIQGMDWKRQKWGPVAKGVLRLAARVASTVPDETIVVSRVLRNTVLDSYGRQSHYIPNGVDFSGMTTARPIDGLEDRPFALFLGRIVPEKQVHVLIEAFSRLKGDYRLAIAGGSSHSDRYVAKVAKRAAADQRIRMLGSRYGAEKAWLLRNAAVFVQPSTVEGLPIALLEALACDCFTIVSGIPENVEAVTLDDDLRYGLVFRTGDADDLAQKLDQAFSRNDGTAPVGHIMRERYDWGHLAERTELVYRQALA
jgi:glycosyltransferase involved in cell wall biosynthesis